MYSSYNNRIENKAFKRDLFALLLTKVDWVGIIPGNEEGVLYFVSFLVLVVVLLCRFVYHSLDIVLSGKKNENRRTIIYMAGICAIQTQQASWDLIKRSYNVSSVLP